MLKYSQKWLSLPTSTFPLHSKWDLLYVKVKTQFSLIWTTKLLNSHYQKRIKPRGSSFLKTTLIKKVFTKNLNQ
jgi:hypothetical protein